MLVTIAYHKDLPQAVRLVRWIGYFAATSEWPMRGVKLLLVPSRHAKERSLHNILVKEAQEIFGEVSVIIPTAERETGWPGACNFMFSQALLHAAEVGEDILWLEPDAVPLCPDWLTVILQEWEIAQAAGKTFMGGISEYQDPENPHMTGIAVYGKNWQTSAPLLGSIPDDIPWDIFARREIMENAHITELIQHVNWTYSRTPYENFTLEDVSSAAAIFHQDKEQKIFRFLDPDGEIDAVIGYSKPLPEEIMQTCYFITSNLSKVQKAQGFSFTFEPLDQVGNAWRGTYVTDNESEILALRSIVARGGSVSEHTEAEFKEETKKKAPNSQLSAPTQVPAYQQTGAQINQRPAVLVENPKPADAPESNDTVVANIEDVVKTAKIKPTETAPKKMGNRKAAKK